MGSKVILRSENYPGAKPPCISGEPEF